MSAACRRTRTVLISQREFGWFSVSSFHTKKWQEMSKEMSLRAFVAFSDVAVYFHEDEWKMLEDWQKELYKDVMKGVHSALISLGHTIVNSDVFFRIKEEPRYYKDIHDSVRRDYSSSSTSSHSGAKPNILIRIQNNRIPAGNPDKEATQRPIAGSQGIDSDHFLLKNDKGTQTDPTEVREGKEFVTCSKTKERPHGNLLQHLKTEALKSQIPTENNFLSESGQPFNRQASSHWYHRKPSQFGLHKPRESEKGFSILHSLIVQQGTYSGERPYPCDKFEIRTNEKAYLSLQQTKPKVDRPFKCALCGKTFRDSTGLSKHRRTHTGGKSYKCTQCEKSFTQKWNLVQHQRTHTGERPYQCTECQKSFMYNSVLIKHQRIHTGERPYQCTQCDKNFSGYSGLVRHQKTHLGLRPYTCVECGECFSQKQHLNKHQSTHIIKLPYTAE
ncbi:zinc finger protein 717-like isoform X2 [Ascaphus truei]|uniref:zinc finger protein 717-like isoform X2 n=1 Tax=Ascaphus truei TaxID=8439 RepID=UPI003F5A6DC0